MKKYFGRKIVIYLLTFFVAVTIDWLIPRFMPGDPVQAMLGRIRVAHPESIEAMRGYFTEAFGLDVPIGQQYLNFWSALFHGDLGISVYRFPQRVVYYDGGPVGVETLAAALAEPRDTIEDVYEPYLLQQGLLGRTQRGRVATRKAYEHLGVPLGTSSPQGKLF